MTWYVILYRQPANQSLTSYKEHFREGAIMYNYELSRDTATLQPLPYTHQKFTGRSNVDVNIFNIKQGMFYDHKLYIFLKYFNVASWNEITFHESHILRALHPV